jgi:aminopeptidase-like protein|tara:strand:+ start:6914 stop:8257 length:1344 start_codon:yes stop_codon:yes gene_type:complete
LIINKYYNLAKNILFPINRSITGNGTLKTLKIIKEQLPILKIKKIKSGLKVFDWTIPEEWNVKEAYILDKFGNKIIDFKNNNLHLVSYSMPYNNTVSKKILFEKLFVFKNRPDAIPYITSYYKKNWGFCISYNQKKFFDYKYKSSDKFKVVINSEFKKDGFLNYGEVYLKGKTKDEILISTYICHPSMANNELSGPIVSMSLINYFNKRKNLEKSIRFVFIPETIGSIAFINSNYKKLKKNVIGGYNLTCIGDDRQHSCMFSKYQNSPSDFSLKKAYKKLNIKYKSYGFLTRGSDERQYNSPGVDLQITSIFRTKFNEYPEYHTSDDNFELVTRKGVLGGFNVAKNAINILLKTIFPKNIIMCEPQMGKRKLYPTQGRIPLAARKMEKNYYSLLIKEKNKITSHDYMNFLQYADGKNSLEEMSEIINISFIKIKKIYKILKKKKLIN